jgi:hypothetical protein
MMPWDWLDLTPEQRAFLIASIQVYAEDDKKAWEEARKND